MTCGPRATTPGKVGDGLLRNGVGARLLIVVVALGCVGCARFGPRLHEVASEHGFTVRAELQWGDDVSGELLSVDDTGLLVLADQTIMRVLWSDVRVVGAPAGRLRWLEGGTTPDQRREMALYSRFPPGLGPGQLQALLTRHGQEEPVVAVPAEGSGASPLVQGGTR